jgi:hypothetical protein
MDRSSMLSPEGWPLADCEIVIFDDRPTGAWAPPMDDPEQRQVDLSGTWTITITGKAAVSFSPASSGMTLGTPTYDAATNTQTQPLTIAVGKYPAVTNLLVLKFVDTQQDAGSKKGTGFRDLKVLMPGYATKPSQLFSGESVFLLASIPAPLPATTMCPVCLLYSPTTY